MMMFEWVNFQDPPTYLFVRVAELKSFCKHYCSCLLRAGKACEVQRHKRLRLLGQRPRLQCVRRPAGQPRSFFRATASPSQALDAAPASKHAAKFAEK